MRLSAACALQVLQYPERTRARSKTCLPCKPRRKVAVQALKRRGQPLPILPNSSSTLRQGGKPKEATADFKMLSSPRRSCAKMGLLVRLSTLSRSNLELIFDSKTRCRFTAKLLREQLSRMYPYVSAREIKFAAWQAWRVSYVQEAMEVLATRPAGSRQLFVRVMGEYAGSKRPAGFAGRADL
eukprot:808480-Rhodomonas_salina.1